WYEYQTAGDDPPRTFEPGIAARTWFNTGAADWGSLSPDRALFARCINPQEREHAIELLDATTGVRRSMIPVDGLARRPVFSPNGKLLYAVCGKQVRGWDIRTGELVMRSERRAGEIVSRLIVSSD